jgi:hypothetical protein
MLSTQNRAKYTASINCLFIVVLLPNDEVNWTDLYYAKKSDGQKREHYEEITFPVQDTIDPEQKLNQLDLNMIYMLSNRLQVRSYVICEACRCHS